MPVELEIPDGDPWYLSPNIWTVPGSDPEGPAGAPVEGDPCYLWARVTNNGNFLVQNATVRFYWANPSVGFDRTTANLVGTSFVTLSAGETQDVLCLTPWYPEYVNQGHECVLAEAFHPSDDPLPGTVQFNVPTDRHVAQRNLSVISSPDGAFMMAFSMHNPSRKAKRIKLKIRTQPLKTLHLLAVQFNIKKYLGLKEGDLEDADLIDMPCPTPGELKKAKKIKGEFELEPGQRRGITLAGMVKGGPTLIHVEQWEGKCLTGGLAVLVVPDKGKGSNKGKRGKRS